MTCPIYCGFNWIHPSSSPVLLLSLSNSCPLVKAAIQLVPWTDCPALSHCFRKTWCYFWGEHGWLTSMVFGPLAFGMLSTAFTPENLTQICVCREGSRDLIIFWELYYLSFTNQVILQTEKKCCVWPSQGCCSMGLTTSQKLKALPTGLHTSRVSADGK